MKNIFLLFVGIGTILIISTIMRIVAPGVEDNNIIAFTLFSWMGYIITKSFEDYKNKHK